MATSPVIEWRTVASPNGIVTGIAFTGSGYNGAIPVGTASSMVTVRIYNNFTATAGVADATNCVLSCYDDTVHNGIAVQKATTALYMQVQVADYNGVTTNADSSFYAIGGQTKHAIPTNNGVIAGASANYLTINLQVVVPTGATQGSVSQGVWLEYNSTA